MGEIEQKLQKLGYPLPTAPPPVGFYVPVLQVGQLVITSGQLPFVGKELAFVGRLGDQLHQDEGFHAARICAVNALAQVKACLGELERVRRIVRVEGYVHSAPGFHNQPHVLNGASELLVDVFGEERGRHTRIALGVAAMPLNAPVQLALWVEAES